MNIIIFGAPGSGKGSQAKLISSEFGIPQISTGDLLREHIEKGTELGKTAKEYINKGHLVPDNLVIDLLKNRLKENDCKNGYILDGFPRTHEQAIQLEKIAKIDLVVYIDITINELEERTVNRRICPSCGKIYNISSRYIEKCDFCGEKLIQREDDKIEVIRERIKVYLAQSEPLIQFYKKKKILVTVFSGSSAEKTYKDVRKVLLDLK